METRTPSKVVSIEYVLAPWHLRARWWVEAQAWRFWQLFWIEEPSSPDQINPLWRRY